MTFFELEVVVVVVVRVVVDIDDDDDELVVVAVVVVDVAEDDDFEFEEKVEDDDEVDEVINFDFCTCDGLVVAIEFFTITLLLLVLFIELLRLTILRVTTRLTLLHETDLLKVLVSAVFVSPFLLLSSLGSRERNEVQELIRSVSVAVAESPALLSFFFLRIIFIILRGRPVD